MKLSRETREILKNFASIQQNLMIRSEPGNVLYTMTPAKTVVARAVVPEVFDKEVRLFDANLLNTVLDRLMDDPEIELGDDHMRLVDGSDVQVIRYASESAMVFPKKDPPDLDWQIGFDLTREVFTRLKNAMSANASKHMVFESDGSEVRATVCDVDDTSSNPYSVTLDEKAEREFKVVFRGANLKVLPRDYHVSVYVDPENGDRRLSKFEAEDVTYYFPLEKESEV